MSLTYGFYNSVNHDRRYTAEQVSSLFDGLINDGIYDTIGNCFIVRAYNGMTVAVGTGRAWFDHTWTYNDSIMPITLDDAELVEYRIDAIVLEVNSTRDARANSIKVLKGTPAATQATVTKPTLTKTDYVHQYPLCYITIPPNAAGIGNENIENKVGTSECPFVDGIIKRITTDQLLAQWEAQFEVWFDNLRIIMDENVAGRLYNMITDLKTQVGTLKIVLPVAGWIQDETTGYWRQTVTVTGMSSDYKYVGPFMSHTGDPTVDEALDNDLSKVASGYMETSTNAFTSVVYDSEKPTHQLELFFVRNDVELQSI